jgi:hypothetical protein
MKVKELSKYNEEQLKEMLILSKLIPVDSDAMFKVKPFTKLKYKHVLKLKAMAEATNTIDDTIIKYIASKSGFEIKEKQILNSSVKSYFQTINQIELNFKQVREYEELLNTDVDSKLESAGAEDLNQFGALNTIDSLAGGDILRWKAILQIEWWDVFNKLYKTKIENDIRKNLELQRQMENK